MCRKHERLIQLASCIHPKISYIPSFPKFVLVFIARVDFSYNIYILDTWLAFTSKTNMKVSSLYFLPLLSMILCNVSKVGKWVLIMLYSVNAGLYTMWRYFERQLKSSSLLHQFGAISYCGLQIICHKLMLSEVHFQIEHVNVSWQTSRAGFSHFDIYDITVTLETINCLWNP